MHEEKLSLERDRFKPLVSVGRPENALHPSLNSLHLFL